MNILHTECSLNWGGQEYRTVLENIWLNNNGYSSWIACPLGSGQYEEGKRLGARLIPVDLTKAWHFGEALKILGFCIKNRVDVVNTHGSEDSTLCMLSGYFGFPVVRSRHITNRIRRAFSYKYGCKHIIASAFTIKKILTDLGISEEKITVIGEGVDLQEYSPRKDSDYLRAEFRLSHDEKIVTNIGMIRDDKGQIYFLDAANMLLKKGLNIRFFMVGKGVGNRELQKKLKNKVREYDIEDRFIMTGYRKDVPNFIRLSDLTVVASIGTEAQSRVVPQSFACRRPVVVTNVGGLPELVEDGRNGLIVPPKDPLAIADAVERLVTDPGLSNRLAREGYEDAIENLSFEAMMQKTLETYARVVSS